MVCFGHLEFDDEFSDCQHRTLLLQSFGCAGCYKGDRRKNACLLQNRDGVRWTRW